MTKTLFALGVALAACTSAPADTAIDLSKYQLVDLTHAFNTSTIYWPTSTRLFEHSQESFGPTPGGWF